MTDSIREIAQRLVDGKWREAARAREACIAGRWADFVVGAAPAAPKLFGRGDHSACVHLATGTCAGPRDVSARILPVWVGESEDEMPATDWFIAHALQIDDGPLTIVETGPLFDDADPALSSPVTARARHWRAAAVVESRSYAPEIEMLLRRGAFSVLALDIYALDSADAGTAPALPRPQTPVPPFCRRVEPRCGDLRDNDVAALRALSIDVDGWDVEPPAG